MMTIAFLTCLIFSNQNFTLQEDEHFDEGLVNITYTPSIILVIRQPLHSSRVEVVVADELPLVEAYSSTSVVIVVPTVTPPEDEDVTADGEGLVVQQLITVIVEPNDS